MRAAAILAAFAATVSLPPLVGQVVDPAHQLATADFDRLEGELEGLRRSTGHAIVVYVVPSLEGEAIDDLAYRAFNTWGVGDKQRDDGVLIVVATGDRRVRIETGKGVGGALTDLQSNDIIRKDMGPLLAKGQLYEGLAAGVHGVAAALAKEDATGPPAPASDEPPVDATTAYTVVGIIVGFLVLLGIGSIVSPRFRAVAWPILDIVLQILSMFSRGGGSGSSSRRDDRYRGGGGRSGGGGSSDGY